MRPAIRLPIIAAIAFAGTFHDTATVDPTATLGTDAYVDAYASVGAWVDVGDGSYIGSRATLVGAASSATATTLGSDAVVGRRAHLATDVHLGTDATLGRSTDIGEGSTAGTRLTALYGVRIGDDAVIGDRATIGALTVIGERVTIEDDVIIARGAIIGDDVVLKSGAIIGPEARLEDRAFVGAGARLRKQVTVRADGRVGADARLGRDVQVASFADVADNAIVRANSYLGAYQQVSGYVERGSDLPDLPPPDATLVLGAEGRAWSDGTHATSCDAYANPPTGYAYSGDTGSGVYVIEPTAQVGTFAVYCDMATPGVGWTLVAKVDRVHSDVSMSEPRGWFGGLLAPTNPTFLLDTVSRENANLATHGNTRMLAMWAAGLSQSRFTLIAEDDVNQRVSWYKGIVDNSFVYWFSTTLHTSTAVCLDPAMTVGCDTGDIKSGTTTNLDGMEMSDHGFTGGVVHMRLDQDSSPHFDAMCSSTGNNDGNAWNDDAIDGHWGNGLEIWMR